MSLIPSGINGRSGKEGAMTTYVGRPLKRFEDPRRVTGQGSFVDDIQFPGMLHAICELEGVHVPERPVLARDKVCYVGQPMAVAVAQPCTKSSSRHARKQHCLQPISWTAGPRIWRSGTGKSSTKKTLSRPSPCILGLALPTTTQNAHSICTTSHRHKTSWRVSKEPLD
jgi:hypothetical protein